MKRSQVWVPALRALGRVLRNSVGTRPRPAGSRTQSHGVPGEASPGQFGPHATRDLTPKEMRSLAFSYAPHPDGDPDPGEVVWTWVPYVENDGRGKDRPVVILSRLDAGSVAGCYLSTKQRHGFVNVGTGGWDPKRRDSYLSPERVLRITHEGMRREGQALSRERFVEAARAVVQYWNLTP